MKKPFVAIDFETSFFPKRKIGLKTMGVDQYLWHPEVEIYLVSVYSDILEPFAGHPYDMDWSLIKDFDWVSHNAGFDRRVFRRLCHLRPEIAKCETKYWQCTANLSTWFGHPRDLKKACAVVFNADISKDARKTMENRTYTELKHSSDWDEILDYAARDAYWCWRLWDELSDAWPQIEKDISDMTTRQVMRGLPCDKEYLNRSIKKLERECWEAKNNIPWASSSNDKAVLSPIALAEECRKINVTPPKSMAEDNPETQQWELDNLSIPWVKEMRRYRKANLLLTKLSTMKNRLRPYDGRFDFSQKYCGAHTKRTSGDQGFNVQGFQRDPYMCGDDERVDMRRVIHSMHGGKLIIADLAQIEPRTLAWITDDRAKIELINKGVSVYEVHAIQTLGWSGGNLKKEDPKTYALCKMRVLGLSYGCGWQRFIDYCYNQFGYELSDRDSKMQVNDFRRKERLIVGLWNQLQTKLENSAGQDLEIELPSWNMLKYRDVRKVAGQITATLATGRVNKIWGSLAVENIIQSTARDCFYEKLIQIENAGIPTLFSVHDEVITDEIPEDQQKDALEIVENIMRGECAWMPGIALDSEITVSPFYLK